MRGEIMKLNFKKIIFSLCTTLIMPTFVSADVGLLVGRNYGSGDINTTTDITKAQTQFTYAGRDIFQILIQLIFG